MSLLPNSNVHRLKKNPLSPTQQNCDIFGQNKISLRNGGFRCSVIDTALATESLLPQADIDYDLEYRRAVQDITSFCSHNVNILDEISKRSYNPTTRWMKIADTLSYPDTISLLDNLPFLEQLRQETKDKTLSLEAFDDDHNPNMQIYLKTYKQGDELHPVTGTLEKLGYDSSSKFDVLLDKTITFNTTLLRCTKVITENNVRDRHDLNIIRNTVNKLNERFVYRGLYISTSMLDIMSRR